MSHTSAPGSSSASEAASASSSASSPPIVETTSWNAVRALASKYGVNLSTPDDIRARIREIRLITASPSAEASEREDVSSPSPLQDDGEDLGIGTPFRIIACRAGNGRAVYRFHRRSGRLPRQSHTSSQSVGGGSSSSSGGGVNGLRHRTPRLHIDDKSAKSDATDADDAGYHAEPDSPSMPWGKGKRKQSNKSLRAARSIPGFRMWQNTSHSAHDSDINLPRTGRTRSETVTGATMAIGAHPPRLDGARQELEGPQKLARLILPPPERLRSGDIMAAIVAATRLPVENERRTAEGDVATRKVPDTEAKKQEAHQRSVAKSHGISLGLARSRNRMTDNPRRDISPFGAPVMVQKVTSLSPPPLDGQDGMRSEDVCQWQTHESTYDNATSLSHMIAATLDPEVIDFALSSDSSGAAQETQKSTSQSFPDSSGPHFEAIDVFDVFQSYWQDYEAPSANTPLVHRDSQAPHRTVHKTMDYSEAALPGDDPRFSLWAITKSSQDETLILTSRSKGLARMSQIYRHDSSSKQSGIERVTSFAPSLASSAASRKVRDTTSETRREMNKPEHSHLFPSNHAFLIAASCTFVIAELTSHIDSRFLTDFFYTYRCYMTSRDLLRLLTLRFAWACVPTNDNAEEATRKIVRVRTYVVLKYWLSHFFEMDFVPNAGLRAELAEWLNYCLLHRENNGPGTDYSIVKSLARLVLSLKAGYEKGSNDVSGHGITTLLSPDLDDAFASASGGRIDLSLSGDRAPGEDPTLDNNMRPSRRTDSRRMHNIAALSTDPGRHHHAVSHIPTPLPLPSHHGTFSRAFTSTLSHFSRLKRHVNAKNLHTPVGGALADGMESDSLDCHDILFIRGGLEDFLDFFGLRPGSVVHEIAPSANQSVGDDSLDPVSDSTLQDGTPSLGSNVSQSTPASSIDIEFSDLPDDLANATFGLGITDDSPAKTATLMPFLQVPVHGSESSSSDLLHHFQSDQTLRRASVDKESEHQHITFEQPSFARSFKAASRSLSPSRPIVQIDDVDLSSDDDDGMVRRALRRLPGARDLRQANNVRNLGAADRESMDSNISVGEIYDASNRSLSSYYHHTRQERNVHSIQSRPRSYTYPSREAASTTVPEMLDPDEALQGFELVKGFRPEELVSSDDEEVGDVEAALLRLEGVVDADKQRERQRRVEAMYMRSQEQQDEPSGSDGEEKPYPVVETEAQVGEAGDHGESNDDSSFNGGSMREMDEPTSESSTPIETVPPLPSSDTIKDLRSAKLAQASKGEYPSTGPSTHQIHPEKLSRSIFMPPPRHRSFLLDHHSDTIAQQFSLIEMELFQAVPWQELTSERWKTRQYPGQVLDWQKFYQKRTRARVEAESTNQHAVPDSNIEAVIARFNLTCNWVASEIVLTSTTDMRAAVISKLIRIAWKCYHQSNFASLTQIILGLQSPWIERLSRTWQRVGKLEMRMLRDLKAFVNPAHDFRHLRNAMRDMITHGHMEDLISSSGPPSAGTRSNEATSMPNAAPAHPAIDGCIPFFGLFLADMMMYDALPALIDPTALDAPPAATSALDELDVLADPSAFKGDKCKSLPHGMKMTPLVNLYKYRMLALTVKSVLALQNRLAHFAYTIDRPVYVKALKLRCLEPNHLSYISSIAEP